VPELPGPEDWNAMGKLDDIVKHYETWRFDWLDVPALMKRAKDVYVYPMIDRDPVPQWTFGRATLLGDAAHPMYPIGSNGGSQAILDASALGTALGAHAADPFKGLAAYESVRRPATESVVQANRGFGPEVVMEWAEERAPDGFKRIEDVISADELEQVATRYRQTAGFDKERLNASV
jgi:2-polyprenyl-6-methoxyphenol hydroxylase-like FAD-dependent oxidoreductase